MPIFVLARRNDKSSPALLRVVPPAVSALGDKPGVCHRQFNHRLSGGDGLIK